MSDHSEKKWGAHILTPDCGNLARAGESLRRGELVAFPTETVWGLGARADSPSAVAKIYAAKGRPSTNPLIVHVPHAQACLGFLAPLESRAQAFHLLAKAFWPGPLTMVLPVKPGALAPEALAGGHTVGVRVPDHSVALELLLQAQVPVAAPSANRSGHVSPTSSRHVQDEFWTAADPGAFTQTWGPLRILDSDMCRVGIESTVISLVEPGRVTVLRQGAITPHMLCQVLGDLACVEIVENHVENPAVFHMDSPGQLLTHYAPRIPCFLIGESRESAPTTGSQKYEFSNMAVLDFHGTWENHLQNQVFSYTDLSPTGAPDEAMRRVFAELRRAEENPFVKVILVVDLRKEEDERCHAIADRLFRAASGRKINLHFAQFCAAEH